MAQEALAAALARTTKRASERADLPMTQSDKTEPPVALDPRLAELIDALARQAAREDHRAMMAAERCLPTLDADGPEQTSARVDVQPA